MALQVRTLIQVAALTALFCVAACHDKPTKPHGFQGDPQQIAKPCMDSHFVYFHDLGNGSGRPQGIYRAPLDSGTVEAVLVGQLLGHPRIDRSGQRLAFVHRYQSLSILDMSTRADSELFAEDVVSVDWYNADTIVCCLYSGKLLAVDVATGATRKLWDSGAQTCAATAEGRIVFIKYLPNAGHPESSVIYTISTAGDTLGPLHTFPDEIAYRPDWNDDGTLIVVVRDYWSGDPWLATLSWPDAVLSDSLAVHAVDPSFAPDGRIVYVRLGDKSRGEKDNICVMNVDGTDKQFLLRE